MKRFLSRTSILGALLLLPACAATLAQNPAQAPVVRYSTEELDNLVAPVALYPDALLAQILVAATFPEQVEVAARFVKDRGLKEVDEQPWDISVRSISHYAPVLNMLDTQKDWSAALGQAYAAQPNDVMDAVQRMREMAREHGNLVTTPEQNVKVYRERIVIEPANPEVIYVPYYEPYYVYTRPIWGFGFHTNYFNFGIGFPVGPWLVYDLDWYTRRVYYHGWHGGWRHYYGGPWATVAAYYTYPHRYVRPNVYVNNYYVNYRNLDRYHRYVRNDVNFGRHDRGDRGGWARNGNNGRDGDRGGQYGGGGRDNNGRDNNGRDNNGRDNDGRGPTNGGRRDGNDRTDGRVASFDDFRPDKGGTVPDARNAEPVNRAPTFEKIEKPRVSDPSDQTRSNGNGPTIYRGGARPETPTLATPPKTDGKANNDGPTIFRGGSRPETPVMTAPPKTEGKASSSGPSVFRGARVNAPAFVSPPKASGTKPRTSEPTVYRTAPPATTSFNGSTKSASGKSSTVERSAYTTYRDPRGGISYPATQPRTVERVTRGTSGGGQVYRQPSSGFSGVSRSANVRPSSGNVIRSAPSGKGSASVKSSGGGGMSGGGTSRISGSRVGGRTRGQ